MTASRWFLEVRTGTWVFWGYTPIRGAAHVEPAITYIDMGVGAPLDFPFELPEATNDLTPTEYERRAGYGWRLGTEGYGAATEWYFAETEEAALDAARKFVENANRQDTRVKLMAALDNIRRTTESL